MQLPFTRSEFLDVFATINLAVWPLQIVAVILGLASIGLLFVPADWTDRCIAAVLAAIWLFTGIVYHWLYFSAINPLARLFGVLFVFAGVIFAVEGAFRGRIRFTFSRGLRTALALLFVVYGLVVYPLVGLLATDPWPDTPLFGVAPCPTTIFTLGMLLIARHGRLWLLAMVPVLWSFIGGSAAILLRVPQDYGLVAAVAIWLVVVFAASPLRPTRT
jgi:hypothetical protein